MTTIPERLSALRKSMAQKNIAAALIPTSDYHASEYVGAYFQVREYFSGFTGSAGTLVVLPGEAGLWTDGRYFIQADLELRDSGITLYREGQPGVPDLEDFLYSKLPEGAVLALDGRMADANRCLELSEKLAPRRVTLMSDFDPAEGVWKDRPPLSEEPVFLLPPEYAGKSAAEKLSGLRKEMEKLRVDAHVLTTLDDIAWLYNFRGADVAFNPVALAYTAVERERAILFIEKKKLNAEVLSSLASAGVEVRPYGDVYKYAGGLSKLQRVLVSEKKVNYALYSELDAHATVVEGENPTTLAKAVKNETERENFRKAHVKDGVAVTRWMYWMKTRSWDMELNEADAAKYMDALRLEQPGCLGLSFPTIGGYGPNAAMQHYHATESNCAPVKPEGFFLLDSGGQYYEGTTDITRTLAVGPLTAEQKRHFTLVLKGTLRLSNAKFLYGLTGLQLDILAREALWAEGLDYNHGTGHGIGYVLCVHEGPNGFRYRNLPGRTPLCAFEPGMVTSVEPGMYVEGSHGIRLENLVLCAEAEHTEYGRFLRFETLTLVPFDLDAVDAELLSAQEKEWLNAYHRRVYDTIAPHLPEEERAWLRQATRAI
ncbi:MAG TPA: aminopeptidase P family protein [Feifaniaceae bacterium]|nr:aminopeptidase P family protein [Feifaniaceae bacterium]